MLSRLKIEYWYQVFVVLGAAGALAALALEIKGVQNAHAFLVFAGMFFVGMGEWINHPLQTRIVPPNIYLRGGATLSGHPRNPCALGFLFDVLGFVLLTAGLYKIIANA